MSIISSIDTQTLMLTQKLCPEFSSIQQISDMAFAVSTEETWIETDPDQIQNIITALEKINDTWQQDTSSEFRQEREKIMSYLMSNWANFAQQTLHNYQSGRWQHRL